MPSYVELFIYKGVVKYKLNDAYSQNDLAIEGMIFKNELKQIILLHPELDGGGVEIITDKRQLKPLKFYGITSITDMTDVNNPVTHTGLATNKQVYDLMFDLYLKM